MVGRAIVEKDCFVPESCVGRQCSRREGNVFNQRGGANLFPITSNLICWPALVLYPFFFTSPFAWYLLVGMKDAIQALTCGIGSFRGFVRLGRGLTGSENANPILCCRHEGSPRYSFIDGYDTLTEKVEVAHPKNDGLIFWTWRLGFLRYPPLFSLPLYHHSCHRYEFCERTVTALCHS